MTSSSAPTSPKRKRKQPNAALSQVGSEPAKLVKKSALHDPEQSHQLAEQGYRFPDHWKQLHKVRPFVGWDGEGITYPGDIQQSYVLFGASTGDRISKPEGLGTVDCFNLLLAVEQANPDAIHVGFALQYDINMILKDLDRRHLEYIYRHHRCRWEGFRIEYRPGKWLSIRRGKTAARLYDVFGFFQQSFVKACEAFLGADDPELEQIRRGKKARSEFTYAQLEPFIIPYWEGELRLLVRLMDSLRDDLGTAGLRLASWHGPGAVANATFRRHRVQDAMGETPPEVNRAAQYAYAGGRFELFRCGHHPGTVWEYDINSAYPAAIAGLPDLSKGVWRQVTGFDPHAFGVWRLRYVSGLSPQASFLRSHPLFYRDQHGNVSYPAMAEGWYWTPEAALSPEAVIDGWVLDHDGSEPFAFVRDMYETRQEWKRQGNSAEKALKLALNSLYGKMAQRSGWLQDGDPIPRWHQLEWAGFVTSTTRANLFTAISETGSAVISVETDAIFTTAPIPSLDIGTGLGQYSCDTFDWLTYVQNGVYYAGKDGKVVERYRGFDAGSLDYDSVVDRLCEHSFGDIQRKITGTTTRFIGLGLGLRTRNPWRSWQTEPRTLEIGGGGKRRHVTGLCASCKAGQSFMEGLHPLTITTAGGRSQPHSLPWLTSREPELRRQDELTRW